MTSPDLTNVVWVKNNIDQHEYPKKLQAYPAKVLRHRVGIKAVKIPGSLTCFLEQSNVGHEE